MLLRRVLAAAALGLVVVACSKKTDNAPAVATVAFSTNRPRVTIGSPIELTYKFDVLPSAAISGDYIVFVHMLGAGGEMLWTDDHEPPVRTSQWKPGMSIGPYTRTRFVPTIPYNGPVDVIVGLYKPGGDERLPLASTMADQRGAWREYKTGQLEILPATENVRFGAGWYNPDRDPANPSNQWRWTQKSALLTFRNPRSDVTLYLESDARPDILTPPQTVSIVVNGQAVTTFAATNMQPEIRRIPISAAQLGTEPIAEIRIEVDRTFNPSLLPAHSLDTRDLGLRVTHVFVETK